MADLVDRHDVIVLELGIRLGFVSETDLGLVTGRVGRVAPPVGLDQLEGDEPVGVALDAR